MELTNARIGNVMVVTLVGRLDSSTAQAAEERFRQVLAGGALQLAIDMTKLVYISSAGLRILLVIAKRLQQIKGRVVLFGLVPNVREIFSISGFDKIFAIAADANSALSAFDQTPG
jgi:anti-anti-sigma factor